MAVDAGGPDFRSLLNDDEFLKLVEEFGGWRLYVPRRLRPGQRLERAIGMDAAAKLVSEYAGCTCRVPVAREFRVQQYLAKGLRRFDIGKRVGISEVALENMLRRQRRASCPSEGSLNGNLEDPDEG